MKTPTEPPQDSVNVHIVSLGCARNLVDSEVMAGLLNKDGYALTPEPSAADFIVVNTCGFIADAKQESIDTILEAAEYKNPEKGRCRKLIIAGCLAERYPGELKETMPEVDLVLGTSGFSKIIQEISKLEPTAGGTPASRISISKERLKDYDLPRVNSQPFYTAYLKLAEGCAKKCSFCIIPSLRGRLRSRGLTTLAKEARDLVGTGVTELNLIAQDLTDYGLDRKDGASLAKLLDDLVKIDKLHWIRLFYAYPDQLPDEVVERVKNEAKICKYLDVPVQHISDEVLVRMGRKGASDRIYRMLDKLRNEIPDIVLRTSLMVGFPGETDADFKKLEKFTREGWFDHVGVFSYSHEEGTPAFAKFEDDIPADVKEARRDAIYTAQTAVSQRRLAEWVGREVEVLVEGFHEDTELLLKSRHYGQAPGIDNMTIINSGTAAVGSYVKVKIEEVAGLDLVGGMT